MDNCMCNDNENIIIVVVNLAFWEVILSWNLFLSIIVIIIIIVAAYCHCLWYVAMIDYSAHWLYEQALVTQGRTSMGIPWMLNTQGNSPNQEYAIGNMSLSLPLLFESTDEWQML